MLNYSCVCVVVVSARRYSYGRQHGMDGDDDEDYPGAYGGFSFSGYGISTSANGACEGKFCVGVQVTVGRCSSAIMSFKMHVGS